MHRTLAIAALSLLVANTAGAGPRARRVLPSLPPASPKSAVSPTSCCLDLQQQLDDVNGRVDELEDLIAELASPAVGVRTMAVSTGVARGTLCRPPVLIPGLQPSIQYKLGEKTRALSVFHNDIWPAFRDSRRWSMVVKTQ